MRILQVFNRYLERGGEEKSVERIANHLEAVGEEVTRFWVSSEEWLGPEAPSKLRQVRALFCNREMEERLRKEVAKKRPDVILTHNVFPVISPVVYAFAQSEEIPLVQFVHNFRPFSVGGSLWTGSRVADESLRGSFWSEAWAGAWQGSRVKSFLMAGVLLNLRRQGWLDGVTHWVAISEFMREKFIEAGVKEEAITALRHAWSPKAELPEPCDEGYYLFLGRLVPEKGITTLLAAWELLEKDLGEKAPRLVIAGTGEEEEGVKDAESRIANLEYRGFVDGEEKDELIKGCRGMLAPSVWWEPLGLVTYEAYDAGKLMIAAASGGLSETVSDGVTGFLHEANQMHSLVDCIKRTESLTPEERTEMGRQGREWLLRETSAKAWGERIGTVLQSVVDRSS